jgi:hypothetical protein
VRWCCRETCVRTRRRSAGSELRCHACRRLVATESGPDRPRVGSLSASGGTSLFMRAGHYCHRPSHMDFLDVRLACAAVIVDPDTFAYNATPPGRRALTSAAVHNTPVVNETEPDRGPRFLWLAWLAARLLEATHQGDRVRIAAEIPARVRHVGGCDGRGGERLRCGTDTRCHSYACDLVAPPVTAGGTCSYRRRGRRMYIDAAEGDVVGWFSPTYGLRQRSTALRAQRRRPAALQINTVIKAVS